MLLVSQSPFQLGECLTPFSLERHVSQLGEICLTFFSLVRHVSHLFQFLAQTLHTFMFSFIINDLHGQSIYLIFLMNDKSVRTQVDP